MKLKENGFATSNKINRERIYKNKNSDRISVSTNDIPTSQYHFLFLILSLSLSFSALFVFDLVHIFSGPFGSRHVSHFLFSLFLLCLTLSVAGMQDGCLLVANISELVERKKTEMAKGKFVFCSM